MRQKIAIAFAITALLPIPSLAKQITVQPGDTLSEIAEKHNISLGQLMTLNKLDNSHNIQSGQKLILPEESTSSYEPKGSIHIVRNGETLVKIAKLYGVNKNDLINLNNLRDSNYIFVGQKINVPNKIDSSSITNKVIYKVQPGDTLGKIALMHKVSQSALTSTNNLNDSNYIYPGQVINIPTNNKEKNKPSKKALIEDSSVLSSSFHMLKSGESLNQISAKYNIPLKDLIAINQIENPNNVNAGRKIFLTSQIDSNVATNNSPINKYSDKVESQLSITKNVSKWKEYGPLKVDWNKWKLMGGSYVAPTINKEGKPLYLAINCNFRKLNSTGLNGSWKSWFSPLAKFEKDLINDVCIEKDMV